MKDVINKLGSASILVVGDVMLDKYIYGSVSRISPEAPVPVLRAFKEKEVLGGAANVAHNIALLTAKCRLAGFAGNDEYRDSIERMLDIVSADYNLIDAGISTTTKIRVVGERQQIVRIDYEKIVDPSNEALLRLMEHVKAYVPENDVVVISDYGKGVMSKQFCAELISFSNNNSKITIVDPKGSDWSKYAKATIITPNVKELGEVAGRNLANSDDEIVSVGSEIREKYGIRYLIVTRSEKGITILSDEKTVHFPTRAQEVFDVSGAGDTVVATMACALGAGADIEEAVVLANEAAGIVVSKIGTVPITYSELISSSYKESNFHISEDKLLSLIGDFKSEGKTVVFTNGCFDILHRGHVEYLKKAKALGDILVLGLNTDSSVKRQNKGEGRPVNNQEDRAFLLSALECVDYVVLFDDDTPINLIKNIRPDILVKGGDYTVDRVVGRQYAGRVEIIDFVEGYSTTNTINKMKRG